AGSEVEKDYAAKMESAYVGAVDATLAAIRKLHAESGERARADGAPKWLREFYADVDGRRMKEFLGHFTPEGRVLFANNPPAEGPEQIGAAIGGLWSAIDGLRHRFVNVWVEGQTTILEAAVSYFRTDGKTVNVPCV